MTPHNILYAPTDGDTIYLAFVFAWLLLMGIDAAFFKGVNGLDHKHFPVVEKIVAGTLGVTFFGVYGFWIWERYIF